MAYIQCSLIGTALDWYSNLHISYKQQWNSIVQLLKKQVSSQKTAYYAQVEAMSLMKKDNETVRHFALRVQKLVKKAWCNENAATINLKNNEIFTKGLPKKLMDFAHKRQVKHVSTLLERSIPFHTLVRHVDFEDIANEKIRTNDLALEINKISFENDNKDKELEPDHVMVLSLGTQITKVNQLTRNIALIVMKTITVFQIVIKNNVTKNTKNIEIRDQEHPNNLLYNASVVNPAILKKIELKIKLNILLEIMTVIDIVKTTPTIAIDLEIMIDTEVTVEIIHKTTIDLILDKDTTIDPKVHAHLDPDMTSIIKEELHPNPHIDHYTGTTLITDIILDQDIDLALNHKETPLGDIITHIDLHPNQEIKDHDLERLHRTDNKTESIK